MLQVAAGAVSVCGSTIGPRQFKDAQRRLRIWAKTEDAWTCLWQSARYLRQALFADWGIYTPWAVYMTVVSAAWAASTSALIFNISARSLGICVDAPRLEQRHCPSRISTQFYRFGPIAVPDPSDASARPHPHLGQPPRSARSRCGRIDLLCCRKAWCAGRHRARRIFITLATGRWESREWTPAAKVEEPVGWNVGCR